MNQITEKNEIDDKALAQIQQQQTKVREHYADAPARFLAAWKQAIELIGPEYFHCKGIDHYQDATDRDQLRPNNDAIEQFISVCSICEGVFIAVVCSFFNGDWGLSMGKGFDYVAMGDIAKRLDLEQLEVLTALMMSHTGW